jgi:hypothetical protein
MSGIRYHVYEIQLQDSAKGETITAPGGGFIITAAGDPAKVVLFNADTFAAQANPVTPTRGKIRFATLATIDVVDIYGFSPTGHFVVFRGVRPGGTNEAMVDTSEQIQSAQIPFAAADYTAAAEIDTGLDFPVPALLLPFPAVRVTTAESGRTIEVGLLASESGGDADGLVDAVSLATAGLVDTATSGTPTLGPLLVQNFATTPAVNVRDAHAISGTGARSISITTAAGTVSARGLILLPYQLPAL